MLSWTPSEMLILVEDEANIEPLTAAGYEAQLAPAEEDAGLLPPAEHFVIAANGASRKIAATLKGVEEWRISVNELDGYQDFTHAAAEGGVELVRQIIRKSQALAAPRGATIHRGRATGQHQDVPHRLVVL